MGRLLTRGINEKIVSKDCFTCLEAFGALEDDNRGVTGDFGESMLGLVVPACGRGGGNVA